MPADGRICACRPCGGTAVRWVHADDTAGGVVEVQFTDADGTVHSVIDNDQVRFVVHTAAIEA